MKVKKEKEKAKIKIKVTKTRTVQTWRKEMEKDPPKKNAVSERTCPDVQPDMAMLYTSVGVAPAISL